MSEWGLYDNLARATSIGALRRTEAQVERLLQSLLKNALHIVEQNQAAVFALADALLAERVLDHAAIDRIFAVHGRCPKLVGGTGSTVRDTKELRS